MLRHTEPLLQYLLVWRIGFVWQQARHWDIAAPCWRRAHAVFTPSTARWRHVRAGRRPHWGRPMCGVWNRETSVPLSGRSSVQKPQTGRGHKPVYYCWLKLSLGRLAVCFACDCRCARLACRWLYIRISRMFRPHQFHRRWLGFLLATVRALCRLCETNLSVP